MTEREIDLLVAEDDPRDAALILAAIRETGSGATVRLARGGAETLGLLHLGVIRAVRAYPSTRWLPIIVHSSSVLDSDLEASYRSGANGYVVKPILFDELTLRIRAILAYWVEANHVPGSQ